MKQRLLSLALCLVLLIAAVPAAQAASPATTGSTALLEFIAAHEGLCTSVYWSGGYAYIGYGNQCDPADYPNGITAQGAMDLLAGTVRTLADCINSRASAYGLTLSQNQLDALLSFTYNFGTGWLYGDSTLFSLIFSQGLRCSVQELAQSWGAWCHIGTTVNSNLADRRARELAIFLYGNYSDCGPISWSYSSASESGVSFAVSGADAWTAVNSLGQAQTVIAEPVPVLAEAPAPEPLPQAEPASDELFSDVEPVDWFYDEVTELANLGILSGYDDGSFRPEENVSCGELLKLVLCATGRPAMEPTGEHWASGYLTAAIDQDVLEEGDVLSLSNPVSRRFMAKVTAHALGLKDCSFASPFADTDDANATNLSLVGVCNGSYDESGSCVFLPGELVSRAEMAAIVWRVTQLCAG